MGSYEARASWVPTRQEVGSYEPPVRGSYCPKTWGLYRGTSLIRNNPPPGATPSASRLLFDYVDTRWTTFTRWTAFTKWTTLTKRTTLTH